MSADGNSQPNANEQETRLRSFIATDIGKAMTDLKAELRKAESSSRTITISKPHSKAKKIFSASSTTKSEHSVSKPLSKADSEIKH